MILAFSTEAFLVFGNQCLTKRISPFFEDPSSFQVLKVISEKRASKNALLYRIIFIFIFLPGIEIFYEKI